MRPAAEGILIADSEPVVGWLAEVGIRWRLMYERQAYERDGRYVFWGGGSRSARSTAARG